RHQRLDELAAKTVAPPDHRSCKVAGERELRPERERRPHDRPEVMAAAVPHGWGERTRASFPVPLHPTDLLHVLARRSLVEAAQEEALGDLAELTQEAELSEQPEVPR